MSKSKIALSFDKLGTAGLFLTALLSPCCFPLFAFVASALGLGSFELFGGWTMWIFQAMVVLSLWGLFLSYRKHKRLPPLMIGICGALCIWYGYHFSQSDYWMYFLYAGMGGLLAATMWNYYANRKCNACQTSPADAASQQSVILQSTLTCPECGQQKNETMPTDACVYFYECERCHAILKPRQGDCCVYCSHGTIKCPPVQIGNNCC